jgi:hypothetical protein
MIHTFCDYKGSYALRLSTATVTLPVNLSHKHRHVIDARRPIQYGGGACNLLLLNSNDHLELLFHATPQTGAVMTPAQAVELAQALTTTAKNQQEVTTPTPPKMPELRHIRQPTNCGKSPGDAPDAMESTRVDKSRWGILFAGHLTAVTSQQVITNPTLLARGNIAQESPRATIARGITQVLGKLIMHALARLDTGIAGATAQGHGVSGEVMPATVIPSGITDPTSNHRGRPHPWILRRWRHRLRTRRHHCDYRGDGRNHRPANHPCASPRHNKTPLGNVTQPPSTPH